MVCELPRISGYLCKENSSSNLKDHTRKKVTDVSCLKHTEAGEWAQTISKWNRRNLGGVLTVSFYFRYVLL